MRLGHEASKWWGLNVPPFVGCPYAFIMFLFPLISSCAFIVQNYGPAFRFFEEIRMYITIRAPKFRRPPTFRNIHPL